MHETGAVLNSGNTYWKGMISTIDLELRLADYDIAIIIYFFTKTSYPI
jgi:hypothetical protein